MNSFQKDLDFGKQCEQYLADLYPDKLEKLDGFKSDFRFKQSGAELELKVERRCTSATPNIFVEHLSNKQYKTLGGPFKALQNGSAYFTCMFWPTKEMFCYETQALTDYLNIANLNEIEVRVGGSEATGFIVKRADIEHLRIDFESLK